MYSNSYSNHASLYQFYSNVNYTVYIESNVQNLVFDKIIMKIMYFKNYIIHYFTCFIQNLKLKCS